MYSHILDQKTFGQVIACAPTIEQQPVISARRVLDVLVEWTENRTGEQCQMIPGASLAETSWQMKLSVLLELSGVEGNEHRLGRVVHQMGLQSYRRRDGYWICWNMAQLNLLKAALAGGENGRH